MGGLGGKQEKSLQDLQSGPQANDPPLRQAPNGSHLALGGFWAGLWKGRPKESAVWYWFRIDLMGF